MLRRENKKKRQLEKAMPRQRAGEKDKESDRDDNARVRKGREDR